MILTTHALAGAVIGKNIDNPWLIIALSLFLHYILDIFRHGEYLDGNSRWRDFWKVGLDLAAGGFIIAAVIVYQDIPPAIIFHILLGMFFSMFPDLLTLLHWKMGMKFLGPFYAFHLWCHRYPPLAPERKWNLRNTANDIVISVISLLLLFL